MDWIVNWIGSNQIVAWVSSLILSMSAIGVLINKYGPRVRRASKIAGEALDVLNKLLDIIEDKKVTKDEIEDLLLEVTQLQEILK